MNQKRSALVFTFMTIIFVLSYRYSLLHTTPMLPSPANPQTVRPFIWFITYLMMLVGLPPSMLFALVSSIFCRTQLVGGIIETVCFGMPLTIGTDNGFFAYIAVCVVASMGLTWFLTMIRKQ